MDSFQFKKYKDWAYIEFNKDFEDTNKLTKVQTDSDNWIIFYKGQISNWIRFYPFSEYHGGGQSYIINIGESDFENWLVENTNFEREIREQIGNE